MRHKHADLIHAWAEGAEIEMKSRGDDMREAADALAAQQEPTEPVAKYGGRRKSPDGTNECWAFLLCKPEFDPPEGTKLYTDPLSGVRAGMLRETLDALAAIEANLGWPGSENALKLIKAHREAITLAADQVNAEGQVEPLQLPPLNEVMYHAVRGLELDFGSGESLFQGSIDDDTLDLIWESINTALRCAKVSPSAPNSASQPDTVAVPIHQLEHWAEYWNGSANEKAMSDALEHILGEVDDLLRAAQEAK